MAVTYNDALYTYKSTLASGHFTDGKYIQGGYAVFATIAERDAAKVKTADDDDHDGVIVEGSFCFVQATDKFYYYTGSAWVEFIASGSTNYYQLIWLWDNDNDEPGTPTITLVGDNTAIALRSLVSCTVFGDNIGSGLIFKKDGASSNLYHVLFPDSLYFYGQWINGIIFISDSTSAPVNLTYYSLSTPSSLTQISNAISNIHPHTIEWEDDTTVEISGLSITTQNL